MFSKVAAAQPAAAAGTHASVLPTRWFDLGTIPPAGVVGQNVQLSPTAPKGLVLDARARVTYADGTVVSTNSIPVIVR